MLHYHIACENHLSIHRPTKTVQLELSLSFRHKSRDEREAKVFIITNIQASLLPAASTLKSNVSIMTAFSKFFTNSVIMALLAQDCSRTDTIRNGDTCDKICVRNSVPNYQLHVYNQWINPACTNLFGGDSVCLAQKGADCGAEFTHIVKTDESCWSISQAYHINMQTFLDNNGLTTSTCTTQLREGQVVCVNPNHIEYPDTFDALD